VRSLLLAASFPPSLGGVETLLYQTTRRLSEPPHVLAPAPAAAPDLSVQAIRLSLADRLAYRPLWAAHPALHYLQAFWRPALRAVSRWRPQVIQAGHIYLAPLALLLARRFGLRLVVYAYGQEVWRAGRPVGLKGLDGRLRGKVLQAADRVLVPGTFTTGLLTDWHVASERIVAVPYGAEPLPFPAPPPSGNTILSVARLVPRKGLDTVIRAMPSLPQDVNYRIVGSGPDESRLRQLAISLGVADRVHFLGRLDDQALADEYRRCALFVLPARRTPDGQLEGYGLVYFEAATWGRPVLAGRSGGEVDAVVDGVTGQLVNGESVADVAQAIVGLLGDPARLRTLGDNGRARVEASHNWTCVARVVDDVLASLA
jgi:phosphatidylinositol alpha-1,6-mannosyltransferase